MCKHRLVATIQGRTVDAREFASPGNMGAGRHLAFYRPRGLRIKTFVAALFLIAAFLVNITGTWAGTTGGLTGSLTDETGKPIAAAKVTATSPSQTATTVTNARGAFTFVSLAPDTYTVSAEKDGYNPVSYSGISVFADNTQAIALRTTSALKTIASVTSRAAGNLVKPGTVSDVYSVNAATQNAVRGLGGGGSLNSAYSGIASVPGVFVPQGQQGWAQSVYVRGSNYTQIGYEYDGVPVQRSFDSYPAATLSALGQQELQVYTGAAPGDAQSQSIGGFINQVIRTGTYPGYATGSADIGTPTFYHKALVEAGGAIPNRLFNYYVGIAGYDQDYRYVDNFNGTYLDPTYGTGYNFIASGCSGVHPSLGCYTNTAGIFSAFPLGPFGEATGPFVYGLTSHIADREIVANFHVGIPHHKDGGRDDIQLLYNNSYLKTQYPVAQNDWTYASNNVINGTATFNGVNFPTCTPATFGVVDCATLGPAQQHFLDQSVFTGPVGSTLTPAMIGQVAPYFQPGSPTNRLFDANTPLAERDYYQNDASIVKVQYQKNMGSNAYARIFGYSFYSDWLQKSLSGATITDNLAGVVSPDYSVITHTYGVVLQAADQINEQNLVTLSGGYYQANTIRWNNEWYLNAARPTIAVAVDSTNPTNGICYGGTPATPVPQACNSRTVWRYVLGNVVPGTNTVNPLVPNATSPDISTIGTATCGGGPCEYFTVGSGYLGPYNTVTPKFTNAVLEDTLHLFNDKLTLNAGVHYDDYQYALSNTTVAPSFLQPAAAARTLYANSFMNWYCFSPITGLTQQPAGSTPRTCPAGSSTTTWSNASASANDYHFFEPRAGLTYTVNPLNVIRASYGKYTQPANTAYQQYQNASNNLPLASPNNVFYQFGFTNPVHQVSPEISYNTDLSWEHQFKGTDMTFKVTPYQRITDNAIFTVLLDPKTNFVSGVNIGRENALGVEFQFQKGDFSRNGLAMLLNYTYTHETVKFGALPNGGTVVDGVNANILQYNAYTKFCATNPTDTRCSLKGNTVLPTNGLTATPCYTSTGGADPACAAGSIANPYWNAPVQSLFNAGNEFVPYNQLPGNTSSSTFVGSSFVVPHVASLVLNYRHNKWAVTPLVQFSGGGKYGIPTAGNGIDPASGCTALTGAGLTGDPRYPFGAVGGAPYNAATCPGALVTPDFATGNYDNFGAFTEPNEISTSLGLSYNVSPRITISALGSNLWVQCFGGTHVPWLVGPKVGCWYSNAIGLYPGNFFNPGDPLQSGLANPYVPFLGNTFQSGYGGQVNPFNLYVTASVRI